MIGEGILYLCPRGLGNCFKRAKRALLPITLLNSSKQCDLLIYMLSNEK